MATQPAPREPSRPVRRVALYALADLLGMVVLATGVLWLDRGFTLPGGAPHNRTEAWTMVLCGAGLLFWSGAGLVRSLKARPPHMDR